ncbi:MAG: phosphatidylglycerophosphatase A [Candidatus Fermentibacteraceae bacterium]|nr:phosphatidylglycerophosphatase A [Candidatus Fermentibacteraceae bacterium]
MSSALDRAGKAVATVLGAGYLPVAPGTAGSLVSAGLFAVLGPGPALRWLLCALFLAIGYWGCRVGRASWGSDPSRVVADEFAGCWIACMAAPAGWRLAGVAAAFILFRAFDIWKPWPVSVFDRMDSPLGILLDDVAAGILSAAVLFAAGQVHVSL